MSNSSSPQDIYDLLQKKEKKSQWSSVLLVLTTLALGLTTLYFGNQAQQNAIHLEMISDSLRIDRDALAKTKADLDSSRQEIENARDSLKVMLLKVQTELQKINTPVSQKIQKEIKNEIISTDKKGYIIYLHTYGTQAQSVSKSVYQSLTKNDYKPSGIENMKEPFENRITYFHEEDRTVALRVAKWTMEEFDRSKIKYDPAAFEPKLASSKYRAPKKQIEVWFNFDKRIHPAVQYQDEKFKQQ